MTPAQLAFVNEKLLMDDERLVPHVYRGPWWRRLLDHLRAIADPFAAFDKELFRSPRNCNTCDSDRPVAVVGFVDAKVFDCVEYGAKPTRTVPMLILVCEECGTQQAVDPVVLCIMDGERKWLMGPACCTATGYCAGYAKEGMHNVAIGGAAGEDRPWGAHNDAIEIVAGTGKDPTP